MIDAGAVWEIRAEHDLRRRDDRRQRRHRAAVGSLRGVGEESLQLRERAVGYRLLGLRGKPRMTEEALDQERHPPAGMRKYPADIGKPLRVAGEADVGDGARSVGAE